MSENGFSRLPEDVVLKIFFKLQDDLRSWAGLACVSTKFSYLIRNFCCKSMCLKTISSVVNDLLSGCSEPPGGWASLCKLSVSCPGLLQAGVLLDNSDFGLERELGPDQNYQQDNASSSSSSRLFKLRHNSETTPSSSSSNNGNGGAGDSEVNNDCSWSLFDDLLFDTVYDTSESASEQVQQLQQVAASAEEEPENDVEKSTHICRFLKSHVASGSWNLSREEGNKLLGSRFKEDCLYICDWPGCRHSEEKRNYMLFRGIFKNFKQSRVWRTINDGNRRSKIDLNCAFCSCHQTWDLQTAFCLRRHFGYHDDGEPAVRAYVCENGHVSGAWTDWPPYA